MVGGTVLMTEMTPLVRELVFQARPGDNGGSVIELNAPPKEPDWNRVKLSPALSEPPRFTTVSEPP